MTLPFRQITFWLALLGLTFLVIFVRANSKVPPVPEPLIPPPEKAFAHSLAAAGIVEALRENTEIAAPVTALVRKVGVEVWQEVTQGDILLQLDDREPRASLLSLEADRQLREAEMKRAERYYQRIAGLEVGAAISKEEAETRQDDLAVAKAALGKAQAAIRELELTLELYTIRAPIDGTVLQVNVRSGEIAGPNSTEALLVLGAIDELQVRADVDEQIAPRVRPGARAVAYRKGDTDNPIELTFHRIEPFITPKVSLTGLSNERVDTRVLQVIFRFQNPHDGQTYVGQQMDIFIEE